MAGKWNWEMMLGIRDAHPMKRCINDICFMAKFYRVQLCARCCVRWSHSWPISLNLALGTAFKLDTLWSEKWRLGQIKELVQALRASGIPEPTVPTLLCHGRRAFGIHAPDLGCMCFLFAWSTVCKDNLALLPIFWNGETPWKYPGFLHLLSEHLEKHARIGWCNHRSMFTGLVPERFQIPKSAGVPVQDIKWCRTTKTASSQPPLTFQSAVGSIQGY